MSPRTRFEESLFSDDPHLLERRRMQGTPLEFLFPVEDSPETEGSTETEDSTEAEGATEAEGTTEAEGSPAVNAHLDCLMYALEGGACPWDPHHETEESSGLFSFNEETGEFSFSNAYESDSNQDEDEREYESEDEYMDEEPDSGRAPSVYDDIARNLPEY
jgi:hypothetical protein